MRIYLNVVEKNQINKYPNASTNNLIFLVDQIKLLLFSRINGKFGNKYEENFITGNIQQDPTTLNDITKRS